jgi:arylsulfatase
LAYSELKGLKHRTWIAWQVKVLFSELSCPTGGVLGLACRLVDRCYPNRIGIHGALGPGSRVGLGEGETTLAELLKQQGYAGAMLGKWHLGDSFQFRPLRHGFDEYFGLMLSVDYWPSHPQLITNFPPSVVATKPAYPKLPIYEGDKVYREEMTIPDLNDLTTSYANRAVKFIEANRARPFFLYLAHSMPHVPLGVSDKFRGKSALGYALMSSQRSIGQSARSSMRSSAVASMRKPG